MVQGASTQAELTKQFDVASDIDKTLLTLATGILTLTITFSKDFLPKVDGTDKDLLEVGWVLLMGSVFFGVWLLFAISGSVREIASGKGHTTHDANVRIPMGGQQCLFFLGVVCMAIFGVVAY